MSPGNVIGPGSNLPPSSDETGGNLVSRQGGSSFKVDPNDPWLLGMGGAMTPVQAVEFKAKMQVYMCQVVVNDIKRQQAETHKASERLKKVAEGGDPDEVT